MSNRENVIEFLRNEPVATVSFTQERYKTEIQKLATEYPDEVFITAINSDGSICVKVPTSWIKVRPPKKMSETQIAAAKERMIAYHANKEN